MFIKTSELNWQKNFGLIPTIIQHAVSGTILMLGFMNKESIKITQQTGYITFFSRTKNRLWTKGEKSGNKLKQISMHKDCDHDTLLILAIPCGPICHTGSYSCFNHTDSKLSFIYKLEQIIHQKNASRQTDSYTYTLLSQGTHRIAQKVGEEGVEVALASMTNNQKNIINEAADLIYHLLVLLQNKSINIENILDELQNRYTQKNNN